MRGTPSQAGMQVNLIRGKIQELTQRQLPKVGGESINLIIAVSFGLFVPPRILKGVEYGGLNIHPSLLPKYVFHSRSKLSESYTSYQFSWPSPVTTCYISWGAIWGYPSDFR